MLDLCEGYETNKFLQSRRQHTGSFPSPYTLVVNQFPVCQVLDKSVTLHQVIFHSLTLFLSFLFFIAISITLSLLMKYLGE